MLRTCIDTTDTSTKEFPTPYTAEKSFTPDKANLVQDNGDIFGKNAEEYRRAFNDRFPEEIPGLPRKRPGDYSPRYKVVITECLYILALKFGSWWFAQVLT